MVLAWFFLLFLIGEVQEFTCSWWNYLKHFISAVVKLIHLFQKQKYLRNFVKSEAFHSPYLWEDIAENYYIKNKNLRSLTWSKLFTNLTKSHLTIFSISEGTFSPVLEKIQGHHRPFPPLPFTRLSFTSNLKIIQ